MRTLPIAIAVALASATACSKNAQVPAATGTGGTGDVACGSDAQCSAGVCLGGKCIPRTTIAPTWAVEIRPPSYSAAPLTERTDLSDLPSPLSLKTDAAVDIAVTFNASTPDAIPSSAHVVLAVPSLIGGRPALTFESDVNFSVIKLHAAEAVLARNATVDLTPLSPSDQQSPPFSFVIDTLALYNTLTIPTDNVWLRGILRDAIDQVPSSAFTARAYQQGRLVSNVAIITPAGTNADGSFRLAIPAAATKTPVTVELSPQSTSPTDPWFTSDDWSLENLDMGVITLPTYQKPQTFLIAVQGDRGEAIDNAFIRAATALTPQAGGVTHFSQDGLTGPTGETPAGSVQLPLIPGTATTARSYDLAIIPSAGTPFTIACAARGVTAGGTNASPAAVQPIVVSRRPVVSGSVTNASGSPVANVVVTARRDPETARVCTTANAAATGPTTISTTTNAMGAFALALDQGAYQLDYDPPAGSWMPRFSQYNQAVSGDETRLVQLPQPALLEGQVSDADDKPLADTTIRIFEPRCAAGSNCKFAPILRGETQTDTGGHLRVVVALPAASP